MDDELLSEMATERMLAGLSAGRYEVGLEPVGDVEGSGTSSHSRHVRFGVYWWRTAPKREGAPSPNIRELRCVQHACSSALSAGGISSACRNPDTCWQHHTSLTGSVRHSEPAPVTLYLLSLLPLTVILIGWVSLRFVGLGAVWA